jgi:uncharacterized protein
MQTTLPRLIAAAILGCLLAATASGQTELRKWRKDYADELYKPNGWLSLVALEWLQDGDTTVGSAPDNKIKLQHIPAHLGTLRQHGGHVEVITTSLDTTLKLDGKPFTGGLLNPDDDVHPSELVYNDVRMTVIHRGDKYFLRVKDAMSPTRLHFTGLKWYPDEPQYSVTAKWVPYPTPKPVKIMNVLGQLTPDTTPGYAEFTIAGKTYRLEPMGADKDGMEFVFRDLTSKTTTDGAGRFLDTDAPSNGLTSPGTVVLNFNKAHNPPCGYTPYATCPLPTEQNRLAVGIPAGEKRYGDE